MHSRPHRSTRRALRLTSIEMPMMRALEGARPIVVSADHVGGRREQLEVLAAQGLLPVGAGEQLVRVEPRSLPIRLAATLARGASLVRSFRHGRFMRGILVRDAAVGQRRTEAPSTLHARHGDGSAGRPPAAAGGTPPGA
jgi:hypothetical protein